MATTDLHLQVSRPRARTYSNEHVPPYRYRTLTNPTQSLRFLRLKRAKVGYEIIDCELVTLDLFDEDGGISNAIRNEKYSALSWCWGSDDTLKHEIYIHEGNDVFSLGVRKNLYDALLALRRTNKNITLWVDAVCINQNAFFERNHQIQLMSLIYGLAESVLVWLGEADDDSKAAMRFIREKMLQLSQFDECFKEDAAPKWRSFLNFMRRPWFSRSWIIQEIALARDAKVICGRQDSDRIQWDDFADAVQLFVDIETSSHRISNLIQKRTDFHNKPRTFEDVSSLPAAILVEATRSLFGKYDAGLDRGTQREPVMKLEYLAWHFSVFEVTVPHDSIYALLSISSDAVPAGARKSPEATDSNEPVPNAPTNTDILKKYKSELIEWTVSHSRRTHARQFTVDYEEDYVEACREFVEFCIHNADPSRALDILCRPWSQPQEKIGKYMGKKRRLTDLPSWVCQVTGSSHVVHPFHSHGNHEPIISRRNADSLVGSPTLSARNYSATGRKPVASRFLRFDSPKSPDYYNMFVFGFELDEIEEVQDASQGGHVPIEWARACGWTSVDQQAPEEFWRTLVADRGWLSATPPKYFSRACQEAFRSAFYTGYLRPSDHISHGHSSVLADFCRRVEVVVWNRALVKTKSNRIGLVPKGVQKGDLVSILYGCSVPVILRRFKKNATEYEREKMEKDKEKKEKWAYHAKNFISAIERRRTRRRESDAQAALSPISPRAQAFFSDSVPTKSARSHSSMSPSKAPMKPPKPDRLLSERSAVVDFDSYDSDPFSALTPTQHYYLFKGECYIHGMMDGQAIQYREKSGIQNSLFEIR